MYSIRSVDGFDTENYHVIRQMHTDVFGDTAPQIDPSEGHWWLAFQAGLPVAFAGLESSQAVPQAGYLCRAGVLKGHRGRGLQLRLIRVRERAARRMGWTCLRTDTTHNPHSSNNLIRAGFKLFEPDVPWAFDVTLYWRKYL